MIRHGETVGNSSERMHGAGDVPLAPSGRAQVRSAARGLGPERFDLLVASPLQRSWQSAAIVAGGAPVVIEPGFREIDFGRWEGMSLAEIEASDPVRYRDWKARTPGFEYPGGEARATFRARVASGLARIESTGARSALLVLHKGVIRAIAEQLLGKPLADGAPDLGGSIELTRDGDGPWYLGRRSSNPAALSQEARA
jgi:broad specificity phosphatase PhoE